MSFDFRPAKRENVLLLLGFAGGTGSGKTMSALRTARGIAGGGPFCGIDTENGRMSHYADLFPELHVAQITAPFRPTKYQEAIEAGVAHLEGLGIAPHHRVVVVDSASHEWAGDGGCLDWHDELMGGDQKKNLSAWIEPKKAHKAMVTRLLQVNAHVILCFRAEPKVEAVTENGRTKIVAKRGLTALDGWFAITEKMLPFELTASFLLMADAPGVPKPIKLEAQHVPFVPLDKPFGEDVGAALAAWAAGSGTSGIVTAPVGAVDVVALTAELVDALHALGAGTGIVTAHAEAHPADVHLGWLVTQLARAKQTLAEKRAAAGSDGAVGETAVSGSAASIGEPERASSDVDSAPEPDGPGGSLPAEQGEPVDTPVVSSDAESQQAEAGASGSAPVSAPGDILIPVFGTGGSDKIGTPLAEASPDWVKWARQKAADTPGYFPDKFVLILNEWEAEPA